MQTEDLFSKEAFLKWLSMCEMIQIFLCFGGKYQIYTISPWNFPGSYGQANYDDPDSDEVGLAPLPEGKVACLKCGKTLINEASGKRHYASSHQPNQPVKCNICKKVYKNKTTRDQHLRQFHGVTSAMMRNVIKPPPAPSNLEVHDLM